MKTASYLPDIPGTSLKYQERGDGPTLMLVPGMDGTALLFYRQVPLLAPNFHVLTFPLPNDPSCTMESLVENLRGIILKVIQKRGLERVLLCGESFGGALSLSFALKFPELLRGLVIVNSFPRVPSSLQIRLAPILLKLMPWGAMRLVRRFTESRLHSPHARAEDLDEFHKRMLSVGKQGYIRRLEILKHYDISDQLKYIETPTLFLAGEADRLVPSVKAAHFMAERMPNATVIPLKGYGHVCLINHDFDLMKYMAPWLNQIH